MTQATPTIGADQSGLQYRNADNDGKKALLNHHKGNSAPAYAEAGVIWLDDTATPWILKIHDGTGWIVIASVNASTNAIEAYHGAAALRLLNYAGDTGAANAYAIAPVPAAASYVAGQVVTLKPANASTGASTLNINGLGAKSIKLPDGTDPASGALKTTGVHQLVYDGTNFVLLNPSLGSAAYLAAGALANNLVQLDGSAKLPAVDGSALTNLPGGGKMVLLATATASSSATLDFTGVMVSAYTQYVMVIDTLKTSTTSGIIILTADDGATFTRYVGGQTQNIQLGGGAVPVLGGDTSLPGATIVPSAAAHDYTGKIEFTISYLGTSNQEMVGTSLLANEGGGHPILAYFSSYGGNGSTPINAVRLAPSAGTFTSGKVYFYGIKNT